MSKFKEPSSIRSGHKTREEISAHLLSALSQTQMTLGFQPDLKIFKEVIEDLIGTKTYEFVHSIYYKWEILDLVRLDEEIRWILDQKDLAKQKRAEKKAQNKRNKAQ